MNKLEHKVALITGGGSGIGKEIACLFISEGAEVIICGRQEEKLKAAISELSPACKYYVADIGKENDIFSMFNWIQNTFHRLDVLVNNASVVGQVAPVEETDLSCWEDTLRINLTGTMLCCREAIKLMKRQGCGTIVNVSSNTGRRGFRNRAPYVCSKWAMHGLTQTIALETAEYGIRANCICPGPVMTKRLKDSIRQQAFTRGLTSEEIISEWTAESPMKRFVTIEECAKTALFLACEDSSGMTGQALNVTAGVIMT